MRGKRPGGLAGALRGLCALFVALVLLAGALMILEGARGGGAPDAPAEPQAEEQSARPAPDGPERPS